MLIKLLLLVMTVISSQAFAAQSEADLLKFAHNKHIPKVLERNVLVALSHYPMLEHTAIDFVFKKNINGSVMQAQPVVGSIFKGRQNRAYRINISALLKLMHSVVPIHQLPDAIMIGWIGHELGHIMDYEQRSKLGLISFGLGYLFSERYRRHSEAIADTYAVNHNLGEYIIATKQFILGHAELPQAYKDKIASTYLSPDDIVAQVLKLEEKKIVEQKKALSQ